MAIDEPYVEFQVFDRPFDELCDEKVSQINTVFNQIVEKVNERRNQLIVNVKKLKSEYTTWRQYMDKIKKDGKSMYSETERKNFESPFNELKEKHIQEVKARLDSIEQEEKYFNKRELHFHIEKDSVLTYIQSLGRLRVKQSMDCFQELNIANKPLCARFDLISNSYYVLTNRNIQVFNEAFDITQTFPLILPTDPNIKQVIVGGIAVGPSSIYISILSHCLIQQYQTTGELIGAIGRRGEEEGELMSPEGIEVHTQSQRLYVCEFANNRVQVFDHGKHHMFIGDSQSKVGKLRSPKSIAITIPGKVIVLHKSDPCIHVYTDDGSLLSKYGSMKNYGDLRGISWIATSARGVEIGTTENGRVPLMMYPNDLVLELNATAVAKCGDELGGVAVSRKGTVLLCDTNNKRLVFFKLHNYLPVFPDKK